MTRVDERRPRRLLAPLRDEASTLDLVRALWPLLAVEAPAPDALPPRRRLGERAPEDEGAPWTLTRRERQPCPYAGGSREETCLEFHADDRSLHVLIDEVVWVGLELVAEVSGPAPWTAAVLAVVEAFTRENDPRRDPSPP